MEDFNQLLETLINRNPGVHRDIINGLMNIISNSETPHDLSSKYLEVIGELHINDLVYRIYFIPLYIFYIKNDLNCDVLFNDAKLYRVNNLIISAFVGKMRGCILKREEPISLLIKGIDYLISRGARPTACTFTLLFYLFSSKPRHQFLNVDLGLQLRRYTARKRIVPLSEEDLLSILERYEKYFVNQKPLSLCLWVLIKRKHFRVLEFLQKHMFLFDAYSFHGYKHDIFEFIPQNLLNFQFQEYFRRMLPYDDDYYQIRDKCIIPKTEVYEVIGKFLNRGADPHVKLRRRHNSEVYEWLETFRENRIKRAE